MGRGRLLLFLILPVVMLAGAGLFASDVLESLRSGGWPSVSGTVVGHHTAKGCGVSRTMYFVQPIYAYYVDGREYTSKRIANTVGQCAKTAADARRLLEENYPLKTSVTVHYDPRDPAAAFLRKGAVSTAEGIMVVVLIVLAVLVFLGMGRVRFRAQIHGPRGTPPGDAVPSPKGKVVFRKSFTFRLQRKKRNDGMRP
jgi:hypothetical protein